MICRDFLQIPTLPLQFATISAQFSTISQVFITILLSRGHP